MYTDVIHTVDANQSKTGTGDGRSRLFPLFVGEQAVIPTTVSGVFVDDWQGARSVLRPESRTNYVPFSWGFTTGRWASYGATIGRAAPEVNSPDGRLGRVTSMQLSEAVGGPDGTSNGVYDSTGPATMPKNTDMVFSVWMSADAPIVVRLGIDEADSAAGETRTVGTTWQRFTFRKRTDDSIARGASISLRQADNPAVPGTTKVYMVYAQTEVDQFNGTPSRVIMTNGAPASTTDYTLSDASILTADPVANGAPLYWTGTGYWVEVTSTMGIVPVDTLSAVTWRFDQSPNLLSLLKAKNTWYASNHTTFWRGWNNAIFDLKNANNFGVAVWAFILNVPLTSLSLRDSYRYWAFGPTRDNFTDSNEPGQINPTGGNFPPLVQGGSISTLEEKVQALRLKYYALTTDCSIASINAALADVFDGKGLCYVEDHEDMSMTYVFTFPISADFRVSMLEYGLLPKPAGVKINITAP